MGDYEMMMSEHEDVMDRVWLADCEYEEPDYNPDLYTECYDEPDNEWYWF
jgi:hypothetical protein